MSIEQKIEEFRQEDRHSIKQLSKVKRNRKALEIRQQLAASKTLPEQKFRLYYELGWIHFENDKIESLIKAWQKSCEIDV
ncbi:MAG: hypothetical protein F6K04_02760 [Leptolyngbya sp. SIO4C5]|nr:hypothetical protein [Leptolyngbya sp. SIO4C5]